ncbi:MAG: hypothetical protein NC038_05625 [Paludibacter sp.]|nr:hypothetical protein [Bacteroidales bacterium]MCM1069852.1 hypothetical protein [Prevotella sp.]MCM1353955.1 hypothetical protein [Bacteroides sp.]MCM1443403.1 hypothetical protein [Muribaculum sp.]MCM1482106.1 hypothetical protein [Paludibacter sp.]
MKKQCRIITIRRGDVKALAQLFGVTPATVWNALNGKTQSKTVERIRKAALNRGAIELHSND